MAQRLKNLTFAKWKTSHKILLAVVLVLFWIQGARFAHRHGNGPYLHTDSTTESMSIFAAFHFLDHGFFKNSLLPTYPPFGHAPGGEKRTEPFVYNHYLAGPDLTLGLFLKVFGKDAVWAGRLIPHTLTVAAIGFLVVEFARWAGSSLLGCLFLLLLMIPRALTRWSICIYGHSYVMAFYLLMVAGIFWFINRSDKATPKQAGLWGFAIGFLQMFFDLDWVPLTFVSALSLCCIFPDFKRKFSLPFLASMVAGGTAAVIYQITISSLHYGSLGWVVQNTIEWLSFRAGAHHVEGITQGDLRLHAVLQEYNRQAYGATGMTAFAEMALGLVFLLMAYLGRARSLLAFKRGVLAVALSYLAACIWSLFMRQHAVAHTHFLPRHYITVYMTFILIALPVASELVYRARRAPAGA